MFVFTLVECGVIGYESMRVGMDVCICVCLYVCVYMLGWVLDVFFFRDILGFLWYGGLFFFIIFFVGGRRF